MCSQKAILMTLDTPQTIRGLSDHLIRLGFGGYLSSEHFLYFIRCEIASIEAVLELLKPEDFST
jgi:hypothetical protein